ncbi:MAG TPA: hypothetical protein PK990_04165, partial [Salinivirgaceae bacterium]|nr:hypothetical protein [Salinivirgaceae bacterium]
MFKFRTLFLCLSLTSLLLSAQQSRPGNFNIPEGMKFTIQGSIIDAGTQDPVEYANVILYSQRDSSMIGGGITDAEGKFSIEIPRPGRFYM